jgi:hypothetical protein
MPGLTSLGYTKVYSIRLPHACYETCMFGVHVWKGGGGAQRVCRGKTCVPS